MINDALSLLTMLLLFLATATVEACQPSTSTENSNTTPTPTTYSRCATASAADPASVTDAPTCRLALSCDAGEVKVPANVDFATEQNCNAYAAFGICYEYNSTSNLDGTCHEDYKCITQKTVLAAGGLVQTDCTDYTYSYVRCLKFPTSTSGITTATCRLYGAGCSPYGEIQSPTAVQARVLGTLAARSFSRQDCEDMAPAYYCHMVSLTTPTTSATSGRVCQLDMVRSCPTGGVKIESTSLFPTLAACNSFEPKTWIKCIIPSTISGNPTVYTCLPYDAFTMADCPSPLRRAGTGVFYPTWDICNRESSDYKLCFNGDQLLECATSCNSSNIVGVYSTAAACTAAMAIQTWARCIDPEGTSNRKCVPYAQSVIRTYCPNTASTDFYQSPLSSYASMSACFQDSRFTLCYSSNFNSMQCVADYITCDTFEASFTRAISTSFPSRSACIAAVPAGGYTRCIDQVTGVPMCRPYFASNELAQPTCLVGVDFFNPAPEAYPTLDGCLNIARYYYCYLATNPSRTPVCILDKTAVTIGCDGASVILRGQDGVPVGLDKATCDGFLDNYTFIRCVAGGVPTCRPLYGLTSVTGGVATPATCDNALSETQIPAYGFDTYAECAGYVP